MAAAQEGLDQHKLEEALPRTDELPFDSTRKRMSTIHALPEGGYRVYVKGAPDVLLPQCTQGPKGPLSPDDRGRITAANEEMARKALRVLAVAFRDLSFLPAQLTPQLLEDNLTFLGLFGLMDPPRPEAKLAVERCHQAGVWPVMITGDHRQPPPLWPGSWTSSALGSSPLPARNWTLCPRRCWRRTSTAFPSLPGCLQSTRCALSRPGKSAVWW